MPQYLQKRLLSFHKSLLEISMMKRVSVLRQNSDFTVKFVAKKQAFYFWFLVNHLRLNTCTLQHQKMEFTVLNCLCKQIEKISKKQPSSQDTIFTDSCIELVLKFLPLYLVVKCLPVCVCVFFFLY